MKKLSFLLVITLLVFACEGKRGPIGPEGPEGSQGPEGPRGTITIILSGAIANGDYDGSFCKIYSSYIDEQDVVQVYISQDRDQWSWTFVDDFRLTNGRVSIYDPYRDYLGYDYEIKIIKED